MSSPTLPLGVLPATPASVAAVQQCSSSYTLQQQVAAGCVLLVDKAQDWTSHDVVARARRACGTRKVGHAGTLDPLATGLLTLGVGPATRLLTHLTKLPKTYTTTVRLGQQTVTDDAAGDIVATVPPAQLETLLADPQPLQQAVQQLTGTISQVPTAVSAIKVNGKRAYELVRGGAEVQLQARTVQVSGFHTGPLRQVTTAAGAALDFDCRVAVSSGTYVRALARDLGAKLGVYGHLTALRRTTVGPFDVTAALPLEQLQQIATAVQQGATATAAELQPLSAAAAATAVHGAVVVDEETAVALGHGKRVHSALADANLTAALSQTGSLLALVEIKAGIIRVITGFPQQV